MRVNGEAKAFMKYGRNVGEVKSNQLLINLISIFAAFLPHPFSNHRRPVWISRRSCLHDDNRKAGKAEWMEKKSFIGHSPQNNISLLTFPRSSSRSPFVSRHCFVVILKWHRKMSSTERVARKMTWIISYRTWRRKRLRAALSRATWIIYYYAKREKYAASSCEPPSLACHSIGMEKMRLR